MGQRGAGGAHRRHHIHIQAFLPAFFRISHAKARGIVHQHIHAPKRGGGSRHPGFDLRLIGKVCGHCMGFDAMGSDLSPRGFQPCGATGADGNRSPASGEAQRNGTPNAAAAARDQNLLAGEIECHGVSFSPDLGPFSGVSAAAPRGAPRGQLR